MAEKEDDPIEGGSGYLGLFGSMRQERHERYLKMQSEREKTPVYLALVAKMVAGMVKRSPDEK